MAYNFQTFGSVVDDAFAELGLDATNTVAGLSQAQMESWGNRFSKIFVEKCKLKTQEDTYSFRTLADTTIASAAASGATSLTTASSQSTLSYPTSGMILLDSIPYTFSAFSSTTMTVEAVDRAYASGDTIQVGYPVPTNFGKPRSLYIDGGSDMVPRISPAKYELQKWGVAETVSAFHFSVFNDYIFLPKDITAASDVTLHYYKKATNTQTTSSTNEIYQMWDGYVVARLVARGHRLLRDLQAAAEYEDLAKEVLRAARQQSAEEDLSSDRRFLPSF